MPIPAGTLTTLRADFGGTIADWVASSAGGAIRFGSATLTFWDSPTGGAQYTDLVLGTDSVDTIHVGIDGKIPMFQGPPGVTSMWVDAGQDRVLMNSADYASDYAASASASAGQAQVAAAAAVAVGSTNDAIIAGRINTPGSATQAAGDARWAAFDDIAIFGHNVMAFGAVGDGVTDDRPAFLAAIAAAGAGGRVFVPPHRYKINGSLGTTPTWQLLVGIAQNQGAGGTATTELLFTSLTGSAIGITLGSCASIRDIVVRGPGYNVGTVTGVYGATMYLDDCSILEFANGVTSNGGYYNKFSHVEFLRNGTGLTLIGCFNVSLTDSSRFDCTNGATFGTAINAGTVRGLSIFGGAIENYATGVLLDSASQLNLNGVYFESNYSGALGISCINESTVTIVAIGCTVYLDNHNTWMRINGSTDLSLYGRNNTFHCAVGSTTTPNAYYFTPGQDVDLAGDTWKEVVKTGCTYAGASSGTAFDARTRIAWPPGSTTAAGTPGTPANPVVTDPRLRVVPTTLQTLAANGAVTFDSSGQNQRVVLQANATSSTITNVVDGAEISITFEQDATGGRTYAWPSNCRFTGGSAPSGTAASTRNTVNFRFVSSAGKWYEISRATAVPVT